MFFESTGCIFAVVPIINKKLIMNIRSLIVVVLFSMSLLSCKQPADSKMGTEKESFNRIVGYVAGYEDFDVSGVDASRLTHINYAFANIVDGKSKFINSYDSLKLAQLVALKKDNPELKILYSIGGWGGSTYFSDVAVSDESRGIFTKSAIELMQKYNLDGIDLDWEYPAQRGPHNVYRPMDKQTFTLLLKEIRLQLNELEQEPGEHYLLTIATGADQGYIDNTELGEAQEYLDFINVMTYDFYHGWHYQTGHHANLFPSDKEKFGGNSALESIARHVSAGVPSCKLVLGVPFYGRIWKGVSDTENGLYQPAETPGGYISYNEIKHLYQDKLYAQLWDTSASAPYLWNADSSIFISYENPKSLAEKMEHIKDRNLGGVMFWEYSLDTSLVLLETLNSVIRR